MNIKRLLLSILIIAIYIVLFEWGFHGYLLKEIYQATPQVWRAQAQMPAYLPYLTLGQVVMAIAFCTIFAWGYRGPGLGQGAAYGFFFGLIAAADSLISYAILPISTTLLAYWILGTFVETILGGILLAAVYRGKAA
jgi:hypothetical protein